MSRFSVILLCATALSACGGEDVDPQSLITVNVGDGIIADPANFLNHGPDATYVGIETCGSCHRQQYDTFVESEMGRSFRQATLSNSNADFDNPAPIYDPEYDLYYQPFNRGEDIFVMEYRVVAGDTVHKRIEQIDFIIGSGHHTNSHMREENGYVYQIPVTWYAQEGRWSLAPGFEGAEGKRFGRPITEACMTCHNAMPDFTEGSENRFDHVPFGIDCERCHGPGSIHVEEKRAGNLVDITQDVDYTIVNPRKLPPDFQLNVCERCHTQGAAVYREGRGPADYRPGMRLEDVENVFMVRGADSTSHFIMASHPDRLRMSACFQSTWEADSVIPAMTCITCHNPHLSIEQQSEEPFSQTCASCHSDQQSPTCTEPSVIESGGVADCVSCHMPTSPTTDIPNVTVTDHYIRIPEEEELLTPEQVEERRAMVRMASLLDANPSDRDVAEGLMVYFEEITNRPGVLDSAAVRLDRAKHETSLQLVAPSLIRLAYLQGDYAEIRSLAEQVDTALYDGWTQYRIGEAYSSSGRHAQALEYFQQAVERVPLHLRFRFQLATAYDALERLDEALDEYEAILNEDPTFEDVNNNRGFIRLRQGNFSAAENDFAAELRLNPDAEMSLANLASLYFNTGRPEESLGLAERLVARFPQNAQYRQFLEAVRQAQ